MHHRRDPRAQDRAASAHPTLLPHPTGADRACTISSLALHLQPNLPLQPHPTPPYPSALPHHTSPCHSNQPVEATPPPYSFILPLPPYHSTSTQSASPCPSTPPQPSLPPFLTYLSMPLQNTPLHHTPCAYRFTLSLHRNPIYPFTVPLHPAQPSLPPCLIKPLYATLIYTFELPLHVSLSPYPPPYHSTATQSTPSPLLSTLPYPFVLPHQTSPCYSNLLH